MKRIIIGKPLKNLEDGVEHIKKGNLDFEIKRSGKDEIGELANAFEGMRQQLKLSVEQQVQYENNRKELISNISHDLKTPITAVKGYVEGIMDGVADSKEKMDRYIKTIYSKANDLDKLIDELFLFSKLDIKKLPFNFEDVDIIKNSCNHEF
jgi:signal transduction histidine kinase